MTASAAEVAGYGALLASAGAIVSRLATAYANGRRSAARADEGAFERAFKSKDRDHRECIEEVKTLRVEVVANRDEIADVRVALARCEEQHAHASEERERDRAEHAREIELLRAEIRRVDRKTPAGGTPRIDTRREP